MLKGVTIVRVSFEITDQGFQMLTERAEKNLKEASGGSTEPLSDEDVIEDIFYIQLDGFDFLDLRHHISRLQVTE